MTIRNPADYRQSDFPKAPGTPDMDEPPKGGSLRAIADELAHDATDSVPGLVPVTPIPEVVRVSPWMYLRTIALLAWSAVRHPRSTTYIDMATGEMVHE